MPQNWRNIDILEEYGDLITRDDIVDERGEESDKDEESDNENIDVAQVNIAGSDVEEEEVEEEVEKGDKPRRVLIFLTLSLLAFPN